MNHKEDCDIDVQACSTMDCTGLIPSLPQSEAEREAYEDLYPYITKAVKPKDQARYPRPRVPRVRPGKRPGSFRLICLSAP